MEEKMRKAVLYIGMSLDGYIADACGSVGWMTGQNETEKTEETGENGICESKNQISLPGRIRSFAPEDLEQVMKLWLNGNLEAHSFLPRKYWESHAEMVKEQLLCAEVLVYEEEGSIKGFAGLQGNYLAGIFVEGSSRSKGIGGALLNHVKETHPVFTLHVYAENERAAAFYRREGLQAVSRRKEEDTGREEYVMEWRAPIAGTKKRAPVSQDFQTS